MPTDVTTWTAFVLHSPYPDGTWRGIEKCVGHTVGGDVMLFENETDARRHRVEAQLPHHRVVAVELTIPAVQCSLDSVAESSCPFVDPDEHPWKREAWMEGYEIRCCGKERAFCTNPSTGAGWDAANEYPEPTIESRGVQYDARLKRAIEWGA